MSTPLPLWYGRPRGAGLASLAVLNPEDGEDEDRGFLCEVWLRLWGNIDETFAALLGFLVPLLAFAGATAGAAQAQPLAAALLGLIALAWFAAGLYAGWLLMTSDEDEAPAWAITLRTALVGLGRSTILAALALTVLSVIAVVLMTLIAASSDRR